MLVQDGNEDRIVEYLATQSVADTEFRVEERAALSHAVAAGLLRTVEALLRRRGDADVDARDDNGRTPSHHAANLANDELAVAMLERLFASGAHPVLGPSGALNTDTAGATPMHLAAHHGNSHALSWLLLHGGSDAVDAADSTGASPLDLALRARDESSVRELLTAGARTSVRNATTAAFIAQALRTGVTTGAAMTPFAPPSAEAVTSAAPPAATSPLFYSTAARPALPTSPSSRMTIGRPPISVRRTGAAGQVAVASGMGSAMNVIDSGAGDTWGAAVTGTLLSPTVVRTPTVVPRLNLSPTHVSPSPTKQQAPASEDVAIAACGVARDVVAERGSEQYSSLQETRATNVAAANVAREPRQAGAVLAVARSDGNVPLTEQGTMTTTVGAGICNKIPSEVHTLHSSCSGDTSSSLPAAFPALSLASPNRTPRLRSLGAPQSLSSPVAAAALAAALVSVASARTPPRSSRVAQQHQPLHCHSHDPAPLPHLSIGAAHQPGYAAVGATAHAAHNHATLAALAQASAPYSGRAPAAGTLAHVYGTNVSQRSLVGPAVNLGVASWSTPPPPLAALPVTAASSSSSCGSGGAGTGAAAPLWVWNSHYHPQMSENVDPAVRIAAMDHVKRRSMHRGPVSASDAPSFVLAYDTVATEENCARTAAAQGSSVTAGSQIDGQPDCVRIEPVLTSTESSARTKCTEAAVSERSGYEGLPLPQAASSSAIALDIVSRGPGSRVSGVYTAGRYAPERQLGAQADTALPSFRSHLPLVVAGQHSPSDTPPMSARRPPPVTVAPPLQVAAQVPFRATLAAALAAAGMNSTSGVQRPVPAIQKTDAEPVTSHYIGSRIKAEDRAAAAEARAAAAEAALAEAQSQLSAAEYRAHVLAHQLATVTAISRTKSGASVFSNEEGGCSVPRLLASDNDDPIADIV